MGVFLESDLEAHGYFQAYEGEFILSKVHGWFRPLGQAQMVVEVAFGE